jgi:molybdopterin converting factor small subunit
MFAALREAAGTGEVQVAAEPLGQLLDRLGARYGERFAAVLGYASVLIDGERRSDPRTPIADGAEVALLPPFSGG